MIQAQCLEVCAVVHMRDFSLPLTILNKVNAVKQF